MDKSVNTSAANVCAFCELNPCVQNAKFDVYALFLGTNRYNRQADDQPEVGFFKNNFTHSDYSRPNSFRLRRPGSGSSV